MDANDRNAGDDDDDDDDGMVKIIGVDPGLASTGVGIVRGLAHKILSYSYLSIDTPKNALLPIPGIF